VSVCTLVQLRGRSAVKSCGALRGGVAFHCGWSWQFICVQ